MEIMIFFMDDQVVECVFVNVEKCFEVYVFGVVQVLQDELIVVYVMIDGV